ncbi:DDE family transposase [Marinilabilia salmonicolor]|jgi:hypothetical protein|uniref:DDE family transposase n=1 Tax=Marinilabilia salmonicolor TaxID=989 RepID=A0A2T0XEP0_9BACT|nr:DDE family transposase [Marinilabilia salmonicolor]RCW35375.1 DDE family transposase [Marinilabilia salmonicolor]
MDLGSQPTMSRLENSVNWRDLYKIGEALVSHFIGTYSSAPEVIILDCDDTNTNTYGDQQLTLFNTYYHDHCYMPLHIYEGLSGKLISTILKAGRRSKQSDVASVIKKLILHIREQWPKTQIIVRVDSHFASKDLMDWSDTAVQKVGYITGLAGNSKLKSLAEVTIKSAEREFKQYGKPVKRYHSFMYKAKSWASAKKMVVKVEASALGTNIRYIVTNLTQFKAKGL